MMLGNTSALNNKNLVVGAGFSGAVIAHLIATELNEKVVVIVIVRQKQLEKFCLRVLHGYICKYC